MTAAQRTDGCLGNSTLGEHVRGIVGWEGEGSGDEKVDFVKIKTGEI